MGREFLDVFEGWASDYDTTVSGHDVEYKEVFQNYSGILEEVAERSGSTVLEFGLGTGNLTAILHKAGKKVYGIEPSNAMRRKAIDKLPGDISISDGDFLEFPAPPEPVDSIVSTYAFHHLTDEEKDKAVGIYGSMLAKGGKIVFADTVFTDRDAYAKKIDESKQRHYLSLAQDLETEYYTTHVVMKEIFEKHGFDAVFTQMNPFVWIMEAVKQ
ncbi:class I SAM-dependent methyltransferase [Bacillus sp. FJAT-42376]|uniref:class I SAM-dependent methyltransferase n=1 Tax=Bacillus sp. FJAT-42376 TaxID=2014076 RepID=UPI000F50839B|nr:class I SAM-dependent methyltransferase [Bacillus sp. FJAT-42376]AZB43710.1 class I SAM-dependent methyltransferase [Bacillus sp. FJAT-42376]